MTERLRNLVESAPRPDDQFPSLFLMVGNSSKSTAIKHIFGVKRARTFPLQNLGGIHIHLDPTSAFSDRPLLVAEGDLLSKPVASSECHETTRLTINRSVKVADNSSFLETVANQSYSQVIIPFVDVICFFADDLASVAIQLGTWLEVEDRAILPRTVKPVVIAVLPNKEAEAKEAEAEAKEGDAKESESKAKNRLLRLLRRKTGQDVWERLLDIRVVSLEPEKSLSAKARYRSLRDLLLHSSSKVRKERQASRYLFSLNHFAAFFKTAFEHFAQKPGAFDFIKASRLHNPLAIDYFQHLSNFVHGIGSSKGVMEFGTPAIASSILLDNYPPGCHLFPPERVFDTLYLNEFVRITGDSRAISFNNSREVILRSGLISKVKGHLSRYFLQMQAKSAAETHRNNLISISSFWETIASNDTCYSCLRRRPQYYLRCGCRHNICENCIVVLGDGNNDDPWLFSLRSCILCNRSLPEMLEIQTHPPTSGVGILCIDGGGTRGIVPLKLMQRIQARIGLSVPFQKFFKVAFGISSGGLIVLDMFIKGRSLNDSITTFEKLAMVAFQPRKGCSIPVLSWAIEVVGRTLPFLLPVLNFFVSCLEDGMYSSKGMEQALQQAFGCEKLMSESTYATAAGIRVGLPVATVGDQPCSRLFTNYNGIGDREQLDDIVEGCERIKLWEIARSASAAPGFFTPHCIDKIGTFQDVGVLENDPLISVLSEVSALFPFIEEPDFVLSLGTGKPKSRPIQTDILNRGWKARALPRLGRLIWERLRDKKTRQLFYGHRWYHRLNVQFPGDEPRLDDVASIPKLKAQVDEDIALSKKVDSIALSILASLFYLELDSVPRRANGQFSGSATILCCVPHTDPALEELMQQLGTKTFIYVNDQVAGRFVRNVCFDQAGRFRWKIDLDTSDSFRVSIKLEHKLCEISGSPFSMERLIKTQGLEADFGMANHRKRKNQGSSGERKKKGRVA